MLRNTAYIIGIELLAAAQGIEFLRPLKSSTALEGVLALVRETSAPMMSDRSLAPDMEAMHGLVIAGDIGRAGEPTIPELLGLQLA
jgi:histidine ammonia-lyase